MHTTASSKIHEWWRHKHAAVMGGQVLLLLTAMRTASSEHANESVTQATKVATGMVRMVIQIVVVAVIAWVAAVQLAGLGLLQARQQK